MTSKRRTKAASKTAEAAGPVAEAPAVQVAAAASAESPAPVAAVVPDVVAPGVKLPSALQIRGVEDVAVRLRAELATGAMRLDAGDVAQVDTAGVQVLVAAIASARRAGAKCEWLAASPALRTAAQRLGVDALLELPAAAG